MQRRATFDAHVASECFGFREMGQILHRAEDGLRADVVSSEALLGRERQRFLLDKIPLFGYTTCNN